MFISSWESGKVGDYFWAWRYNITYSDLFFGLNLLSCHRVCITRLDGIDGSMFVTEELRKQGWETIGHVAIAPIGVPFEVLAPASYGEWYFYSEGQKIPQQLGDADVLPSGCVDEEPGDLNNPFWSRIREFQPAVYISDNESFVLVAKDEELFLRAIAL